MVLKCAPATSCCCGCSVPLGVKCILGINLLINIYMIVAAFVSMVFFRNNSLPGYSDNIALEFFMVGVTLAGLPLIIAGIYGVSTRNDVLVAVYFYYYAFMTLLEIIAVFNAVIIHGGCSESSLVSLGGEGGRAFMCSVNWVADAAGMILAVSVQAYFAFVIFSFLQDLECNGKGASLGDLTSMERKFDEFGASMEQAYMKVLGQHDHVPAEYGSVYEAVGTGLGDGENIFGTYHDINYPPKAK